jgi:hypothetical protein
MNTMNRRKVPNHCVITISGTDLTLQIEGRTGSDQNRIMEKGDEPKYTRPNRLGGGAAAQVIWKQAK